MNIVFDFGGVLFRWQPLEFMARLLPQRAATPAQTQALITEFFEGFRGDWGDFDRGAIEPGPLADRIAARTGIAREDVARVIDAIPHELEPLRDTVGLLHRLHHAGHALFFLSNMPAPYADHLEATHDFIALFRRGVFSARAGMIKPNADIYAHAIEAFGIDPAHTLFIDDVAHNIDAAHAAGWQGIVFRDAADCEAQLVTRGLLPGAARAPRTQVRRWDARLARARRSELAELLRDAHESGALAGPAPDAAQAAAQWLDTAASIEAGERALFVLEERDAALATLLLWIGAGDRPEQLLVHSGHRERGHEQALRDAARAGLAAPDRRSAFGALPH